MRMSGFTSVSQSRAPRNLTMRSKTKTSEKPRKMKQLSSDPQLSCRVFCNLCDRPYYLSGLRKHVAHKHSLTYTEYKLRYGGDPKRQVINTVYHPCLLCQKVVLLDTDELGKHLKDHRLGYTQYMKEHMKKGSGLITSRPVPVSSKRAIPPQSQSKPAPIPVETRSSVPAVVVSQAGPRTRSKSKSLPVESFSPAVALPPTPPPTPTFQVKKEPVEESSYFPIKAEPMEVVEPVIPDLIIIKCEECDRTFKQNIQLKVHIRKHHS